MKFAKILTLLGVAAMTGVLIYGFTAGDFFSDGGKLLANPWGIVSMVDLYTGFILFSGWIFYRERSWIAALLWSLAVMCLGFFAASLYAFIALQTSSGSWQRFWMGRHAA